MEGFSRDLLCGIGRGADGPRREQRPPRPDAEAEEVELNLGLSLGGRFGLERRGAEKLARSTSVAAIFATPEEVAPPALFRTSSLPTAAAAEAAKKQGLDDLGCCRRNGGVEAEPAARLPASGSPSSGSSDGEGRRLEVNMTDTLMRTSSLPAGIEDEWRKRKEAQSLKRLEVKRKRIERRNSLTSNVSKESVGQILEEMNTRAEKVESCDDVAAGNKMGGNANHIGDKNRCTGLPPVHRATSTQQRGSLSGIPTKHNPAVKGPANVEEHNDPSAIAPPTEHQNSAAKATPFSALAVRAIALASRGEQLQTTGRVAARAKSMGDVEQIMMQEMPCVCTKGLPNGKRVEGFLYKYRKGEEVRIVCVCHGSFLTPAEFVKHAGGGDVANPLRHIVVNPIAPSLY
ncbi:ninja-family protein MODD-like [Oryza brachyantha]|uniref:ninja-family protein MODD-like n=1 Tax=Oryza brachyantha TaxID=4533 RepID=UPI0007765E6F|nr:ninja-family protein MODD-like [Oryza brachyantha]